LAGEGEGRLINARTAFNGDTPYYARVAGCVALGAGTGIASPRGAFTATSTAGTGILAAYSGVIRQFDVAGGITTYTGTLTGTDRVTFAQNYRSTPDVAIARQSGGAYQISWGTFSVSAWADADLPATVNSVSSLSNYFLFTDPTTGRIWSSDLASTAVNGLSFASAESHPDLLIRGLVSGNTFYAFGAESIEPWLNLGKSPFPLGRQQTVIPDGLLEFGAVAGAQEGWGREIIYVSANGSPTALDGYTPRPIGNAAVERFIADSTLGTFQADVYVFEAQPIWALTTNLGTWEYNLATKAWNERVSTGASTWRAVYTTKFAGAWHALDRLSSKLLKITSAATEDGAAIPITIESGDLKGFPSWVDAGDLFLEFTRGAGTVDVSWSIDGGANYTTPETVSLTDSQGPARLNNIGTTGPMGLRVRITTSTTSALSFLGAQLPDLEQVPG
jgi:hypothetical protein